MDIIFFLFIAFHILLSVLALAPKSISTLQSVKGKSRNRTLLPGLEPGRNSLLQLSERLTLGQLCTKWSWSLEPFAFQKFYPFLFLFYRLFDYFSYSIEKRLYKKPTLCCKLTKYITWEEEEIRHWTHGLFKNNSNST